MPKYSSGAFHESETKKKSWEIGILPAIFNPGIFSLLQLITFSTKND